MCRCIAEQVRREGEQGTKGWKPELCACEWSQIRGLIQVSNVDVMGMSWHWNSGDYWFVIQLICCLELPLASSVEKSSCISDMKYLVKMSEYGPHLNVPWKLKMSILMAVSTPSILNVNLKIILLILVISHMEIKYFAKSHGLIITSNFSLPSVKYLQRAVGHSWGKLCGKQIACSAT